MVVMIRLFLFTTGTNVGLKLHVGAAKVDRIVEVTRFPLQRIFLVLNKFIKVRFITSV